MAITVQLNGFITITDNQTNSLQLQKQIVGSYTGTISEFAQQVNLASGANAITLPGSPVQFAYVRNLSTTATIIVTWTPTGGASNVVCTLQPGAYIILNESNTTSGITALSLNASQASTPCEYILVV
jgi:hypothetical protein